MTKKTAKESTEARASMPSQPQFQVTLRVDRIDENGYPIEANAIQSLETFPAMQQAHDYLEFAKSAVSKAKQDGSISITWSVADVLEVRPALNADQAAEVLRHCKESHDSSVGITWEVLDLAAEACFPEPQMN